MKSADNNKVACREGDRSKEQRSSGAQKQGRAWILVKGNVSVLVTSVRHTMAQPDA